MCLHPVTELLFNRHGGSRVHVSTCGHTMHLACYQRVKDTQNAASRGRMHYPDSQAIDARKGDSLVICPYLTFMQFLLSNPFTSSYPPFSSYLSFHHPFVCSSGEMLCPLCKSLVNTLVPHVTFAATKLLARRSISTLPPSNTSLSTTSTAMLVQPPDSTIPPSSSSSTLLSILAVPFVPQNWYHRIQQCQLLPSPSSTSESADGIAPAGSPLQRYFAQSNIAACVHTYDQALQALCGTTPSLPTRYIKLVIATKY